MTMDIFAFRKQWRMTKARIQATWFWRVFGVRAMQKGWTKFLVAVAIMAGFWRLFSYVCPILNMVYTFPPNKWRTRWDKV
ncbi:hypothetical protein NBH81_10295 [Aeromonas veronii]|uniref:hypothetical protein n=1 Tax=Aeromonas veronii TaxID=654 RepID=UPI0021D8045F|nr:hypothetical protein [Aeromonas veronii]UYB72802.1 hypothetical protein NBH81_10295 [Aeromonas veronii]